jgi:16S rRNA (guanine1207-N2)-methyltransferase
MSRWAADPEAAADALMLRALDDIGIGGIGGGRVLLVNQAGSLPSVLQARGVALTIWNRRLAPGLPASPWPPCGPFDAALVRLPKAREELAMTLHATASVLREGARIAVYGGNEEGIRGAGAILGEVAGEAQTIAARHHGRVLGAHLTAPRRKLRDTLGAWRTVSRLEVAGAPGRDWVSYPGTFAHARLDDGTALLLGALRALPGGSLALDYACGTGHVAAALLAAQPTAAVHALDNDTVALEAVRENVPRARRILGTRIADAGSGVYHAIVSNPPLHRGFSEDHALLESLIADAGPHLAAGGVLELVVQRRIPLERLLGAHFGRSDVAAENARYRVWRAVRT